MKRERGFIHAPKNGAGFTLIELMVVVIILGVLAAFALPRFITQQKKAKEDAAWMDMEHMTTACELYYLDQDAYPVDLDTLETCTETGCPYMSHRRDLDTDHTPDTPWSKVGAINEYQYATYANYFSIWLETSGGTRIGIYRPNEGVKFHYPPLK